MTGAALCGEIADQLHLAGQGQHVGIEPRAEQHVGLNVLRLAVRFGLAEDCGETAEHLEIGGDGGVME